MFGQFFTPNNFGQKQRKCGLHHRGATTIAIKDAAVIAAIYQMEIQPKDPSKRHFYVSLVKSLTQIVAGIALITGLFVAAGTLVIAAEVLGIVGEQV